MFGKKSNHPSQGNIDCLISGKTRIDGDVQFEGGLRVDGEIKGNLTGNSTSVLIVSEAARLEGEVHVAHAVVNGSIKGSVHVTDQIELQAKARIFGDVHYRTLEMHPGAVVEGHLVHQTTEAGKTGEGTVTPLPANRANN
jgi:cytoskeletal protein CcmA (bactofilin family)